MKTFFLIFALVLAPVFWTYHINQSGCEFICAARAQTGELKAAKQELRESYEKLVEIKESEELTSEEKDRRELEARISTLEEVVRFTIAETKSLISRLFPLKGLAPEFSRLQVDYLKVLKEVLKYQERFLTDLTAAIEDGSLDLTEVTRLASDFKIWRETVYDPSIKKIVAFLLAFRSSDLLTTATSRLNKIAADLKLFQKSKLIKAELLIPILEEAGTYLLEAAAINKKAMESLLATTTDPAETQGLIGQVLELIKSAYGKFLEMSGLVKKMLSTN